MPPSPRAPNDTAYDERRLGVLVAYSASLRWQMLSAVLVTAALAWLAVPAGVVVGWVLLCIVCRELRAAALLRLARSPHLPIAERLRRVGWWTLALGVANGGAAVFMFWLDTAGDAMITMILVSLAAGAVSTTFTVLPAFVAYAGGIVLPSALVWMSQADLPGFAIGLLILMYLGVQVRFARQNLGLFEESYRIRSENAELLAALSDERVRLAQARDVAVAADLSKSRFLAAASHDLRQPLQSLALNSATLSRLQLNGETREIAHEISVGIEALRQMLDTLLDVSKLDAGAVSPVLQPVPLDRLVQGLVRRYRSAAQAKGLRLEEDCAAGTLVMSDMEMLQRVISNVLDNAIKFTAVGGVSVVAARRGDRVAVTVSDTGCGVAPEDQQRVFEDLVQLANPQRDRALGHGLGLGIVRRLSHLLGIEYEMESRPGAGTRFHLYVPASDAVLAVMSDGRRGDPSLVARRVLVLDDDGAVREAYQRSLSSLGCKVHAAASLEQALALLASHDDEVALVDYRLAGPENGLSAIELLRRMRPGLAAVLVTADTSAALRETAAREGVPVVRKPVTEATLTLAINDALREVSAHKPLEDGRLRPQGA